MAAEFQQFTVTIPAGTPATALYVAKLPMTLWTLEGVDLEVPPGPAGLMGFYLALSGEQWIPRGAGQFLIWDDVQASWRLDDQPTSYGWELHGYNLDAYDHSVVVRFHVSSPSSPLVNVMPSLSFAPSTSRALGVPL